MFTVEFASRSPHRYRGTNLDAKSKFTAALENAFASRQLAFAA